MRRILWNPWVCDGVWRSFGYIVITAWVQLWGPVVGVCSTNENIVHVHVRVCVCAQSISADYVLNLGSLGKRSICVPASPQKARCDPNCSPRTPAQLVVFYFFFFSSSSFSLPLWLFQLPYFVILWSPPGGNFCAGYDLKELANHAASLKLEQDVTKGPGPMVSAALRRLYLYILYDFYAAAQENSRGDVVFLKGLVWT